MADAPRIDKEFQSICPAHTPDERARLENSLLAEGQRDPILTWRGLIIDGYTRLEILQSLGIEPRFAEHPGGIDSREDAIQWIVNNQLGRRNLTDEQKRWLRGNRYLSEKNRPGAPPNNKNAAKKQLPQDEEVVSGGKPLATKIGKEYGVAHATMSRDALFAKQVREIDEKVPGAKEKILAGDLKLNRKNIAQLAELPAKEIKKVLQSPETAREALPRIVRKQPENQSEAEFLASQVDAFCKRIEALIGMVPVASWMPEARIVRVKDTLRSAAAQMRNICERRE